MTSDSVSANITIRPPFVRERFQQLPPFAAGHLENSLAHLAGLVTGGPAGQPRTKAR